MPVNKIDLIVKYNIEFAACCATCAHFDLRTKGYGQCDFLEGLMHGYMRCVGYKGKKFNSTQQLLDHFERVMNFKPLPELNIGFNEGIKLFEDLQKEGKMK